MHHVHVTGVAGAIFFGLLLHGCQTSGTAFRMSDTKYVVINGSSSVCDISTNVCKDGPQTPTLGKEGKHD
jgi:hypothetical protein